MEQKNVIKEPILTIFIYNMFILVKKSLKKETDNKIATRKIQKNSFNDPKELQDDKSNERIQNDYGGKKKKRKIPHPKKIHKRNQRNQTQFLRRKKYCSHHLLQNHPRNQKFPSLPRRTKTSLEIHKIKGT